MTSILFHQYRLPLIGAMKTLATQTLWYVSVVNFFLIAATAYHTTIGPAITAAAPWFTFPAFIACMISFLLAMMVFEFKFVQGSMYRFASRQSYRHENPIKADMDILKAQLADIQFQLSTLRDQHDA